MIDKINFSSGKTALTIPISMITFYIINLIVKKIVYSFKNNFDENANLWRLKNTSVSWCHSIICSILVMRRYCLYRDEEREMDIINVFKF
jgi:hypothetical protein